MRHLERASVVGLASDNPLINRGQSRLISKDQALALTQNNQTAAEASQQSVASSQQPVQSGGSPGSSGGSSSPPQSGGGSSIPPAPPPNEPFSVDLVDLQHDSHILPDPGFGGNTTSCTVMHQFIGTIRANNGPGSFTYHWEQKNGQRSADFTETPGPGESFFEVRHGWPITSPYGSSFDVWVKLVVTHPSFEQRQVNFKHQC